MKSQLHPRATTWPQSDGLRPWLAFVGKALTNNNKTKKKLNNLYNYINN